VGGGAPRVLVRHGRLRLLQRRDRQTTTRSFYHPYELYPAPIFAVPGNHDAENLETEHSLDGFVRNFCAPKPAHMPEAGDSLRTAMTQPNVYWTLLTPLVNIIGLYSNVPEGGKDRTGTDRLARQRAQDAPPPARRSSFALHHPVVLRRQTTTPAAPR